MTETSDHATFDHAARVRGREFLGNGNYAAFATNGSSTQIPLEQIPLETTQPIISART
jgi:hypothetical protein